MVINGFIGEECGVVGLRFAIEKEKKRNFCIESKRNFMNHTQYVGDGLSGRRPKRESREKEKNEHDN